MLSLAGQTKLSSLELVLGGASSGMFAPARPRQRRSPITISVPPQSTA